MIVAGDIGGTKCNLAIFEEDGGALRLLYQSRLKTRDFDGFEPMIRAFLGQVEAAISAPLSISAAGFGVPGTVLDGKLYAINMPWGMEIAAVARILGIPEKNVVLMNDLVATASGLDKLSPQDFLLLHEGVAQLDGNKALIAAGTGLGEAVLYWDGRGHRAAASEGGSAIFAPRNEREIDFLLFLRKRLPRVSCEEIFCGRGFRQMHEFLDPSIVHESFRDPARDSGKEITQNAISAACPVCVAALDFWMDAFGAEAGNLALRVLAYGGVYLAGGIAVKILPKLKESKFRQSFSDMGPMSPVLHRIPISVVLNEDAPVLGAAYGALASL